MGQEILVTEHIDAGARFLHEFNDVLSVSVAFWVNPAESDNLFLYIASDEIDDSNIRDAYGQVLDLLKDKRTPWLDPFQIKLVNSADPIARDAIKIRDRYSAKMATRYNGASLGRTSIDGAYIYPPVSTMKSAT